MSLNCNLKDCLVLQIERQHELHCIVVLPFHMCKPHTIEPPWQVSWVFNHFWIHSLWDHSWLHSLQDPQCEVTFVYFGHWETAVFVVTDINWVSPDSGDDLGITFYSVVFLFKRKSLLSVVGPVCVSAPFQSLWHTTVWGTFCNAMPYVGSQPP